MSAPPTYGFDFNAVAEAILPVLTFLVSFALPVINGLKKPDHLEKLLVIPLACSGGISAFRTQLALEAASTRISPDMPAQLFASLVTLGLMSLWAAAWLNLVPRLAQRVADTRSLMGVVTWAAISGAAVYGLLFVLAPLPGAIASRVLQQDRQAEGLAGIADAKLAEIRSANAARLCVTLANMRAELSTPPADAAGEKRYALATGRIDIVLHSWGLSFRGTQRQCQEALNAASQPELKQLLAAVEAQYRAATRRKGQLLAVALTVEPAATDPLSATNMHSLELASFFSTAITHPGKHVERCVNELDLPSSVITILELAALTLIGYATVLKPKVKNIRPERSDLFDEALP